MSFVQVGGDAHSKPTYFELLAADALVPSLKSAVVYTLSVLSQRYPRLHRILRYEDELLALLLLLVDWHSLSACDATFAEGLYGLRRRPRRPLPQGKAAAGDGDGQRLTAMQRNMGLLLQVLQPTPQTYAALPLDGYHTHSAMQGITAACMAPFRPL